MKFTIERSALLPAVARVAGIIPKQTISPILSHVLIEAHADGSIIFKTMNLDMQSTARTTGLVQEPGSTTVAGDKLHQIAKNAAVGSDVSFDISDARLTIRTGRSRFALSVLPVRDFPALSVDDWTTSFDLPAGVIADALARTRFAAADPRDARAFLAGVRVAVCGLELHIFATQGHQIAFVRLDAPEGATVDHGATIPLGLVAEFIDLCAGEKSPVTLRLSTVKAQLVTPTGDVVGKLMDGTYIDYLAMLGRNSILPHTVECGREALQGAVRRVTAVQAADSRLVRLAISDGVIQASARNQEGGDADDEVSAEVAGASITLGFNGEYILDALGTLRGERVRLDYEEKGEGVRFTSSDDEALTIYIGQVRV